MAKPSNTAVAVLPDEWEEPKDDDVLSPVLAGFTAEPLLKRFDRTTDQISDWVGKYLEGKRPPRRKVTSGK